VAIYRMLQGMAFDDHSVKAMTSAYEAILVELGLTNRTDPLTTIAASKIITIYQMGERERVCQLALEDIRG
jgi:hypothetical protein